MEGIYGWLDVNYLSGHLQPGSTTVGAIDVGGASLQVSFATEDTTHPADEVTLHIHGQPFVVFSKSFLGLGQIETLKAISATPNGDACFPTGYHTKGHFDSGMCSTLYAAELERSHIKDQLPPLPRQTFIGFSGMYYTLHDFLGLTAYPTQTELENGIAHFCTQSWAELQQQFPHEEEMHLMLYCGSSVFYDELLFHLLHIPEGSLEVQDHIQQQPIDWTLGSLLYTLLESNEGNGHHDH